MRVRRQTGGLCVRANHGHASVCETEYPGVHADRIREQQRGRLALVAVRVKKDGGLNAQVRYRRKRPCNSFYLVLALRAT